MCEPGNRISGFFRLYASGCCLAVNKLSLMKYPTNGRGEINLQLNDTASTITSTLTRDTTGTFLLEFRDTFGRVCFGMMVQFLIDLEFERRNSSPSRLINLRIFLKISSRDMTVK